jgi:capsular polysaccharide biosynthesis protein
VHRRFVPSNKPEIDRLATIWRAKFYIVIAAIVVAALTYEVCRVVPKTFQSSATVRISLPPSNASLMSSGGSTAAGSVAAQYVPTATLSPVLSAAAKLSHTPQSVLSSSVSAATISGENLIQVSAEAREPSVAATRANAVATALTNSIASGNSTQAAAYNASVQRQLAPLNAQIKSMRSAIGTTGASTATVSADQSVLSSLIVQRGQLQSAAVQNMSGEPTADVFAKAGPGSQVEPQPPLYTAVAFIVAALVAAQIAVAVASYRQRSRF